MCDGDFSVVTLLLRPEVYDGDVSRPLIRTSSFVNKGHTRHVVLVFPLRRLGVAALPTTTLAESLTDLVLVSH